MKLLYPDEHFSCRNYEKGSRSAVQLKKLTKDCPLTGRSSHNEIVILLKGTIRFSYGIYYNSLLKEKQMLFLPASYDYIFSTDDDAELLILSLSQQIIFCECYLVESLMNQTSNCQESPMNDHSENPFILGINTGLEHYLEGLLMCINKGLLCSLYFEMKIKEFFYLLRVSYHKEELALFFSHILSEDASFSHFVTVNCHKYNTLSDMAKDMGMSLSKIEKLFTKVFRMSGYKWMNQQKANKLYHALCTENTPFKELAMRFGFSSASSLNDFCKNKLDDTPGMIRRKIRIKQNDEKFYKNS